MKKTKVFFMVLLVTITLLGFSGTSQAFDLSKITSKPVEWGKYIAKKLGFGDSDEKDTPKAEPEKALTVKEITDSLNYPENQTESLDVDIDAADLTMSPVGDEFRRTYGWQGYSEKTNYIYGSEDWYFRIGSRTGEIIAPFTNKSISTPVWQTKVEYLTVLPWESLSQLSAELFLESAFSQQQATWSDGPRHDSINEIYSLNSDDFEYSLRINASVKDAKIGLYGWNGNDVSPLNASPFEFQGAASELLWRPLNSGLYQRSNNLAATISYELPFMNSFHQGLSPTVRLETAYRFGANKLENGGFIGDYDQWKVGMAYEGNNRINWLNTYGINWGVGYNYTVTLDDPGAMDNLKQYSSHSGNINANTYWFNMKLYTMFMYRYDRETRESMTVLNATYKPDWNWSYGIKANFYYNKKDGDSKELIDKSELVTFTATYRWD